MSEIVSLEAFKKKKEESSEDQEKQVIEAKEEEIKPTEDFDFEAAMKANKEKADKMAKEREKNNKGVKRSYNLRPDDPNNRRR